VIDSGNGHGPNGHVHSLIDELRVRNGQLERALQSRILVEQAKGVLAERYGITVEEAFELLRRGARSSRVRIHHLAAEVVDTRRSPTAIELERVKPLA
jgi:AmiR/NasT family two-component response regulator